MNSIKLFILLNNDKLMVFFAATTTFLLIIAITQWRNTKKLNKRNLTLETKELESNFFLQAIGQLDLFSETRDVILNLINMSDASHRDKLEMFKSFLKGKNKKIENGAAKLSENDTDTEISK